MTKILVRGPALSQSGYGEHCRSVLRALKSRKSNDVYLINVGWGESGWIYEDSDERRWIDSLILKTSQSIKDTEFDVSVQVQLPIEWQRLAKKNIGITAGVETDTVPENWCEASEAMDAIIVPSEHTKSGFAANAEVHEKISVIGYPVRKFRSHNLDIELKTKFNFLTVAQWSPRKNVEQLVSAFVQEFMNEDVGLVLKLGLKNGSEIDRHYTLERLNAFMSAIPSVMKCKIYLLHGSLTENEMAALYTNKNINAYVTASHGEGFGLPVFEAVSAGLPVIASSWGGVCDFTQVNGTSKITEVSFEVDNVKDYQSWTGVLETTAKWCFPDFTSLRAKMREVYSDSSTAIADADTLKKHVGKQFSNKKINKLYNDVITNVLKGE
mgnify:CR=1 FL=1